MERLVRPAATAAALALDSAAGRMAVVAGDTAADGAAATGSAAATGA